MQALPRRSDCSPCNFVNNQPVITPPAYYRVSDMALRWSLSIPTARNWTRQAAFPAPLGAAAGARWLIEEVIEWEQTQRTARRRVVTGSLPQHHRGTPDLSGVTAGYALRRQAKTQAAA